MSDRDSELYISTFLRGRQVAEFLAVKDYLGIQSNAEIIRHLIHKQARVLRRRPLPRAVRSERPGPSSVPAPLDREGRDTGPPAEPPSTPPDVESLCLSCSLPDCDETDPGCLYQQAVGRRETRLQRLRAYSRALRAARDTHDPKE
jgi:hypothetical protein